MDILDILLDILLKPPQPLMGLFLLCVCSDLRPIQDLIHADMDLDIKAKEQLHPVVLQLEFGTQT